MVWGTGEDMFVVWVIEWFIGELKNGGSGGSFYSLEGGPWQWRIPLWEAKSLLRWSSLSIRQGTAVGTGFLCDE